MSNGYKKYNGVFLVFPGESEWSEGMTFMKQVPYVNMEGFSC